MREVKAERFSACRTSRPASQAGLIRRDDRCVLAHTILGVTDHLAPACSCSSRHSAPRRQRGSSFRGAVRRHPQRASGHARWLTRSTSPTRALSPNTSAAAPDGEAQCVSATTSKRWRGSSRSCAVRRPRRCVPRSAVRAKRHGCCPPRPPDQRPATWPLRLRTRASTRLERRPSPGRARNRGPHGHRPLRFRQVPPDSVSLSRRASRRVVGLVDHLRVVRGLVHGHDRRDLDRLEAPVVRIALGLVTAPTTSELPTRKAIRQPAIEKDWYRRTSSTATSFAPGTCRIDGGW